MKNSNDPSAKESYIILAVWCLLILIIVLDIFLLMPSREGTSVLILALGGFPISFQIMCAIDENRKRKEEIKEKKRVEAINKTQRERTQYVRQNFPNAYSFFVKDFYYSKSSGYDSMVCIYHVTANNVRKLVFTSITDQEWEEREESVKNVLEILDKWNDFFPFIKQYPYAFYEYCKRICKSNNCKLERSTYNSHYYDLIYSRFNFRLITDEAITLIHPLLNTIDTIKLSNEEDKIRKKIEYKKISDEYRMKVLANTERQCYVDRYLDYLNVEDNRMLFALNHLKELDAFIIIEKQKESFN